MKPVWPIRALPAASVSFETFSHPSLSPRFFQTACSSSCDKPGQQQAHALVGGHLGHLDHNRLDDCADETARGRLPHRDLEPHLRGPRTPAAGGLDRRMKRERSGRMANREDRRLAWLHVVAQVEPGAGGHLNRGCARPAPSRGRGRLEDDFFRDAGLGRSETREEDRVNRQPRPRGPAGAAGASDPPPGRIDLDRHGLLGFTGIIGSGRWRLETSLPPARSAARSPARSPACSGRLTERGEVREVPFPRPPWWSL